MWLWIVMKFTLPYDGCTRIQFIACAVKLQRQILKWIKWRRTKEFLIKSPLNRSRKKKRYEAMLIYSCRITLVPCTGNLHCRTLVWLSFRYVELRMHSLWTHTIYNTKWSHRWPIIPEISILIQRKFMLSFITT